MFNTFNNLLIKISLYEILSTFTIQTDFPVSLVQFLLYLHDIF